MYYSSTSSNKGSRHWHTNGKTYPLRPRLVRNLRHRKILDNGHTARS
ncbi:GSCOCG00002181001-RA-CDS [Cotesia congregata]|nr:GSCOCG00002181001-RA-CDS [Cotesia congregata]